MSAWTLTIPALETARLRLRAPEMRDFEAYAAFRASPRAVTVGGPFPREVAFDQFCALIGHWALRGYGRWVAADRETDTALGVVGLFCPEGWPEPEIGWSLFEAAEGKGYALEAARAARAHAYGTLGWSTVASLIRPDNARSIALARRMGATREGVYQHPTLGPLEVWRHLSAAACAAGGEVAPATTRATGAA
jgi:ribosomal-protein-alanine N-acetyltransferase